MSLALAFVVSAAFSAGCLWAVAKWAGFVIPTADLLIIAGLCSALALLPGVGWVLASVFLSLLLARLTDADPWPDAVAMVVGANLVWLLVKVSLLGWM
jgi:hypothetical protein